MTGFRIQSISLGDESTIRLIADRMRLTLMEVVGEEEGASMYTQDWLEDRVRQHLDPTRLIGCVFVARSTGGDIVGHCIVRQESDENGDFGLFSTFYVDPKFRGMGIGGAFVEAGEKWFADCGISRFATYTAEDNVPLHRLMGRFGYKITLQKEKMVAMTRVRSTIDWRTDKN